jgi:hypothetical protein
MSSMQVQTREELKYPTSTLLKSSNDLGWQTCSPSSVPIAAAKGLGLSRRMPESLLRFVARTRAS